MTTDYEAMTRHFLLGEGKIPEVGMASRLQALEETLNMFRPHSQTEAHRLETAMDHLREMKRQHRRIAQENKRLQEKINLLEEEKNNARIEEDYS